MMATSEITTESISGNPMDSVIHPLASTKLRITAAIAAGMFVVVVIRSVLLFAGVPRAVATGPIVTGVAFATGVAGLLATYVAAVRVRT